MEANVCDINHLDADVLLPPRKRLLAGFKKQTSDGNGALSPAVLASSTSSSTSSSCEFDTHLNILLTSHLNNPKHTPKELVEASRSAAVAAVQAAQDARAAADEKAAIAAKAVIAARNALDLVASFSEEGVSKERCLKKNKLKKHVPVQLLYTKHQPIENHGTDEELARRLHRAINSSPRISKHSPNPELKGHKHKKPKNSPPYEKASISDVGLVLERSPASMSNEHAGEGEENSESSSQGARAIKADEKGSKYEKDNQLELDIVEAESSHSKEKIWEETNSPGRRRGRVKLKKLPLSICTYRDQGNPKEEMVGKSSLLTQKNTSKPTATGIPLFSLQPSTDGALPIEATPTWKCQEFKAPACIKQNKVMQS